MSFNLPPSSLNSPCRREAPELAWVAIVVGCANLIAAPLVLCLYALVWQFADNTPGVVEYHAWLARVGAVLIGIAALTGAASGLGAMRRAKQECFPCGVVLVGLVMSSAGAGLATIAILGLLDTTESRLPLTN
jgi:hypothetical protein